jgi:microcystin-dependent protein
MMFAGTFAPVGYLVCNGQILAIAENEALFNLLGTTYGGDGMTTFGLPNLCGRASIGAGSGPGRSTYVPGQVGGTESVTLTTAQLPVHTHAAATTSSATAGSNPVNAIFADKLGTSTVQPYAPATGAQQALAPGSISLTGSGNQHENRQPYLAITICIAQVGVYPTQA